MDVRKEMIMKNIRFYPITGMILFLILTILGALSIRGNAEMVVKGQYEEAAPEDYLSGMQGYEVSDDSYSITGEDPQLWLDLSEGTDTKAYGIRISFEEEVDLANVQLFFGREEMVFAETDQHSFPDGETEIIEVFSAEPFECIRLDINEPFTLESINAAYDMTVETKGQTLDYIIMVLINLVVAVGLSFVSWLDDKFKKLFELVKSICKGAFQHRKNVLIDVTGCVALFGVAFAIEMLCVGNLTSEYINKFRFLVIFVICVLIFFSIRYQKYIMEHIPLYLFLLIMIVGTVNVISAPPSGGISWDDEIHYGKTAYLSYGADDKIDYCDYKLINNYADVIYLKNTYASEDRGIWAGMLNEIDENRPMQIETNDYKVAVEYTAYVPAAVALSIGRGLGLNFTHNFMFGKFVNLFCYALLMSLAAGLLKRRGSVIVSILALIPTSLFIASAYAYDWWIVSFIVLGYAMFIHELEEYEEISWKKFLAIMVIMIVGILPKAVYFPLIFPMLLLGKNRYSHSKLCRGMAVAAMGILIGSFLMPILASSGNVGDVARANPGVDSAKQIGFILSQPLEYTKILLNYLGGYLSPLHADEYLTNFAYYGKFSYFWVCILAIVAGCIFDNRKIDGKSQTGKLFKAGVYVCAFGSIVLVVTALYITFTPVAHETVLGCQARYLLPVLFPVLYCVSEASLNISQKVTRTVMVIGSGLMAAIFLYGIYSLGISFY